MEFIVFYITVLLSILGILSAYYYGKKQGIEVGRQLRKEKNKEEKLNLVNSLLSEIIKNEIFLKKKPREDRYEVQTFETELSENVYTSSALSGKFLSFPTYFQNQLYEYYQEVHNLNIFVKKLEDEDRSKIKKEIFSQQIILINSLIKKTPNLKKMLNDELT
jgi:hypothetical protein